MKAEFTDGQFSIYLLRHQQGNPKVLQDGWVVFDELIKVLIADGRKIDKLDLIKNLEDSRRVTFSQDYKMIRANHGHSNGVKIVRKALCPPKYLYHGTGREKRLWIAGVGLKQKNKLIHLTDDLKLAYKYANRGRRKALVYRINSLDMNKDGFEFYLSTNNVWLTKEVPIKYLNIVK